MSRGSSGRIVIEIDPLVKDSLYIALAKRKLTLKDWFLSQSAICINQADQPQLPAEEAAGSPAQCRKE